MKPLQAGLAITIVLTWFAPAEAQMWFSRKPRSNPSQRVPELILILKTEPEERKRLQAAIELRDYDATTYAEIVPVLADVVQHDKKMNVRLEAVNSLARIRPVNPLAVSALEKASNGDESWRVRWQAKTSLTRIQLTGFASKTPAVASKKGTDEPPVKDFVQLPNTFTVEVAPMEIPAVRPIENPAVRPDIPAVPAPADIPAPRPFRPTVTPPLNPPVQGPALFPQ